MIAFEGVVMPGKLIAISLVCIFAILSVFSIRASAATSRGQFAMLRAELEASADYGVFVAQKTATFEAGTQASDRAHLARAIAGAFEHCAIFAGVKREEFLGAFYRSVQITDARSVHRIVLANWMYQQCAGLLDDGTADLTAMRIAWLRKAAALHDQIAQLALYQVDPPNDLNRPAFIAALHFALDSGDPEALWEAGRALNWAGIYWPQLTGRPFPASGDGKSMDGLQAVYQLAACQLGFPCDQDSLLIKRFCVREHCRFASYADWLPSFMSDAQIQAVQSELPRVLKSLRARAGSKQLWKTTATPSAIER
jgi:hypothetical protein